MSGGNNRSMLICIDELRFMPICLFERLERDSTRYKASTVLFWFFWNEKVSNFWLRPLRVATSFFLKKKKKIILLNIKPKKEGDAGC